MAATSASLKTSLTATTHIAVAAASASAPASSSSSSNSQPNSIPQPKTEPGSEYYTAAISSLKESRIEKDSKRKKQHMKNYTIYIKKAAEAGHAKAQYSYGKRLLNGKDEFCDIEKDTKKAMEYFRLAALKGNLDAQYILAWIYETGGSGIDKNMAKAFEYYQLIAQTKKIDPTKDPKRRNIDAQYRMGLFYDLGVEGVIAKNMETAFNYYFLAAFQGHLISQFHVGFCYKTGNGTVKDNNQALLWLKLAADRGEQRAQCAVGDLYNNVFKNGEEALKYYQLAARQSQYSGLAGNAISAYTALYNQNNSAAVPTNASASSSSSSAATAILGSAQPSAVTFSAAVAVAASITVPTVNATANGNNPHKRSHSSAGEETTDRQQNEQTDGTNKKRKNTR